jgi:hypothetical protein
MMPDVTAPGNPSPAADHYVRFADLQRSAMTAGNEIVLPVRRPVTSTVTSHLGPMPAAASRACAALRSLARPLARRWLYSHRRTVSGNTAYHPLAADAHLVIPDVPHRSVCIPRCQRS